MRTRGERLRNLREQAGLTLREVARRASLHQAILSDLERDTGTRRLMSYARTLRLVLGDEVIALVAEEERDRAETEGLKAMAAQMTARLERAITELIVRAWPPPDGGWTEDPADAARMEEHRRAAAEQIAAIRWAEVLDPVKVLDRAGMAAGGAGDVPWDLLKRLIQKHLAYLT